MKSFKELRESLSHDYVLQSLADKDINAHVKGGKLVVHPDDAAEARKHLKKIGHDHLKVTTKGVHQVAEEVSDKKDDKDDKKKWREVFNSARKAGSNRANAVARANGAVYEEVEELDENLHRVGVWTTEPNHTSYDKRENKRQKMMRVTASSQREAEQKARAHFENNGYKVHNTQYMGAIKEEVEELDEIKLATVGKIIKHSPKIASAAIGAAVAAHSAEPPKQPVKASFSQFSKKVQTEEVELDEVLDPSQGAGEYVKDFEKSDEPQFKDKSKEKRHQMAIAAYLSAKRKITNEDVALDESAKDWIIGFAIAGGLLLGGSVAYNDHKLEKTWTDTYNKIQVSNPEQAKQIKSLVSKYKNTNWKFSQNRDLTKQEIENIIQDTRSKINK